MEVHVGHLITTDWDFHGSAWGTSQQTGTHVEVHEGHLSLPILSLLVLGGCCLRPLAPCFQPLEQTITTVIPDVFSHGMEYHHHSYSYTRCFQPWNGTSPPQLHPTLSAMGWNITTTVTPNAFSHGMEHHHHSYTQHFQPWDGTSPPQLQLHPMFSAMEWNITTTVTHNDQLAWTHSVPVSQWSLSADFNSSTPVTQCQRHILTGTTDMFTTLTHLAPDQLSLPTLSLYCETPDCPEAAS